MNKFIYLSILFFIFCLFLIKKPTFVSASDGTLNINKSVTEYARPGGFVKVYAYKFPSPSNISAKNLSGFIKFSSSLSYIAQSAVAVWYSPTGVCPNGQTVYTNYQQILTEFPGAVNINFYNLILSKPGNVTIPVDHSFSVRRPMPGCVFITFDMAAYSNNNNAVGEFTTTANIFIEYDTNPFETPAPYAFPIGSEFCFGTTQGCVKSTTCTNTTCAFARVYKVKKDSYLTDIFGDVTAGPFSGQPYNNAPTGPWSAATDFYVYKSCDSLQVGANGPDDYYSKIPQDAMLLYHVPMQSTLNNSVHIPVSKVFTPISLETGNCLVGLTKFFSGTGGGVTINAPVYALLQSKPPLIASPLPSASPFPIFVKGDLDGDGFVNMTDYNIVIAGYGAKYTIFDYNNVLSNFNF